MNQRSQDEEDIDKLIQFFVAGLMANMDDWVLSPAVNHPRRQVRRAVYFRTQEALRVMGFTVHRHPRPGSRSLMVRSP